jgi:hypothetical protein
MGKDPFTERDGFNIRLPGQGLRGPGAILPRHILVADFVASVSRCAFQQHRHRQNHVSRKPANGFHGLAAIEVSWCLIAIRCRTDAKPVRHHASLSVLLKLVMSELAVTLYGLEIASK